MEIISAGMTNVKNVTVGYAAASPAAEEKTEPRKNTDTLELSEDYLASVDEINETEESEENGELTDETEESDEVPEDEEDSESGRTTVAVNVLKRQRQIAAAENSEDLNVVLGLLAQDLADCKQGLENGWCDESEVAKAESLIQQAKARMAEVARNDGKEDNGFDAFDLSMLM